LLKGDVVFEAVNGVRAWAGAGEEGLTPIPPVASLISSGETGSEQLLAVGR
jgi:hypothetical protein